MSDMRNAVLIVNRIGEQLLEFSSNGRRIRRRITKQEADTVRRLIDDKAYMQIDSFCYRIA